ncbi:TetR/AcrR family transcriptional regulator [Actinomycetospora atypica]|uniref:TetR/AcrR family transcriptional regulator n=1 Tax=Actinomycetospora atypica TaxID=1290095 RepID=A0ABV9YRV3_9PSEU
MSPPAARTLRETKKQRTREVIMSVATALFDEHGYDAVTVGAVAEAAEVGQRTLYRHFADKEDFLFSGEDELYDAMKRAAADAPDGTSGLDVLAHAVRATVGLLESDRAMLVRRARVIARTPALQARERTKQAALQQMFVGELERRGHAQDRARLVAAVGTACVGEAITRWLEHEDEGTLARALDGVEEELRSLLR